MFLIIVPLLSKYLGDNWDNFLSKMPASLLNHINGNAIYNLTSPSLEYLIDQLELEADSVENSIPYDLRIAQIILEANGGPKPNFSPQLLAKYPTRQLSKEIKSHAREIESAVRETPIIGNYASTNVVKPYIENSVAIIHGAKLRASWDDWKLGVSQTSNYAIYFIQKLSNSPCRFYHSGCNSCHL